jgi:hypothetical protein
LRNQRNLPFPRQHPGSFPYYVGVRRPTEIGAAYRGRTSARSKREITYALQGSPPQQVSGFGAVHSIPRLVGDCFENISGLKARVRTNGQERRRGSLRFGQRSKLDYTWTVLSRQNAEPSYCQPCRGYCSHHGPRLT